jgi:hypothetical protein
MYRHKYFYTVKPKDYKTKHKGVYEDVTLRTIGLFNTEKLIWRYFAISTIGNGSLYMTPDITKAGMLSEVRETALVISDVLTYGIEFKDVDEAKKYVDSFVIKWETGSNNTIEEIRDKKIDMITNG